MRCAVASPSTGDRRDGDRRAGGEVPLERIEIATARSESEAPPVVVDDDVDVVRVGEPVRGAEVRDPDPQFPGIDLHDGRRRPARQAPRRR